jgi:hypothetical protein
MKFVSRAFESACVAEFVTVLTASLEYTQRSLLEE